MQPPTARQLSLIYAQLFEHVPLILFLSKLNKKLFQSLAISSEASELNTMPASK